MADNVGTTGGEAAVNHFRTADLPERERFPTWRRFTELDFPGSVTRQPDEDVSFCASLRFRALTDVQIAWGLLGATLNARPQGKTDDDFTLFVNLHGATLATQHGCEFELGPGDAYLMAHAETGSLDRWTAGSMVCLRMTHDAIAPFVRDAHACIGQAIPREAEGLRLLTLYAQLLDESESLTTQRERDLAAAHVLDLLALALGATADAREVAGKRGVRAAKLKAIKAHVERHAARTDLSLENVSVRFGIAPRVVQRLFEEEGTTFTAFVHERRLLLAHRMLTNRRFKHCSVGAIALDAGFGDLSYFNRLFRSRFGATPSDIRNQRPDGISEPSA